MKTRDLPGIAWRRFSRMPGGSATRSPFSVFAILNCFCELWPNGLPLLREENRGYLWPCYARRPGSQDGSAPIGVKFTSYFPRRNETNNMIIELPKTVAANIQNFTGRTWLLPTVLKWLEQTEDRLFILT